jgi:hypothetical protein
VIRHSNFDYLTNTVNWDPTIANHTLPNSFYLSSKPAFFGGNPWPWVDPIAGVTYTLPAKKRYDAGTPFASRSISAPTTSMATAKAHRLA